MYLTSHASQGTKKKRVDVYLIVCSFVQTVDEKPATLHMLKGIRLKSLHLQSGIGPPLNPSIFYAEGDSN